MLELKHISVHIGEKEILHDISYAFQEGSTTAILGQNGSGKSSLALSLAGHPRYTIVGELHLNGVNITSMNATDRHIQGIFLSFQNIPEIPGIKVAEYLRTIYNEAFLRNHPEEKPPSPFVFRRMVEKLLPGLHLDRNFLERDLFVGFSGGEKRRIELLQISLLDPSIIILDEVDSGLDIDAIDILRAHVEDWRNKGKSIIIISHNFQLLESIHIDSTIILRDGQIDRHGDQNLVELIKNSGFQEL